jgi:hypothetical protein
LWTASGSKARSSAAISGKDEDLLSMPILKPSPIAPPRIAAVREVRCDVPYELQIDLDRFYGDILGLPRWPTRDQLPGGCGYGHARRGLMLCYSHATSTIDPAIRRLTLVVESLDRIERLLMDHSIPFERLHGFFAADDVLSVADPAGYRMNIRSQRLL